MLKSHPIGGGSHCVLEVVPMVGGNRTEIGVATQPDREYLIPLVDSPNSTITKAICPLDIIAVMKYIE